MRGAATIASKAPCLPLSTVLRVPDTSRTPRTAHPACLLLLLPQRSGSS